MKNTGCNNNGINVLSLFDGISCGMVALERAGIKVDEYIAYEIEEDAIKVSKSNYRKSFKKETFSKRILQSTITFIF